MRLSTIVFGALIFAASAGAQVCTPLPDVTAYPFSVGQPSLQGIAPVCLGDIPPLVLFQNGNPQFQLGSNAPLPIRNGSPTALLFMPVAGGIPIAAPAFPYCGFTPMFPFGPAEIPMIPALGPGVFSLPAPPAPGGPVAMPLPPGIPIGILGFVVITIGLDMSGAPCLFATDGIRIGTI